MFLWFWWSFGVLVTTQVRAWRRSRRWAGSAPAATSRCTASRSATWPSTWNRATCCWRWRWTRRPSWPTCRTTWPCTRTSATRRSGAAPGTATTSRSSSSAPRRERCRRCPFSVFFQGTVANECFQVLLYDMRKPGDHVDCWTEPNNMSPVTGLAYLPYRCVCVCLSFYLGRLSTTFALTVSCRRPAVRWRRSREAASSCSGCSRACSTRRAAPRPSWPTRCRSMDRSHRSTSSPKRATSSPRRGPPPATRRCPFFCADRGLCWADRNGRQPTVGFLRQTRHTVCAPTWNQIGADATAASAGVCSSQPVASIQAGSQQKFMSRSCLIAVPASTEGASLLAGFFGRSFKSPLYRHICPCWTVPGPSLKLDITLYLSVILYRKLPGLNPDFYWSFWLQGSSCWWRRTRNRRSAWRCGTSTRRPCCTSCPSPSPCSTWRRCASTACPTWPPYPTSTCASTSGPDRPPPPPSAAAVPSKRATTVSFRFSMDGNGSVVSDRSD